MVEILVIGGAGGVGSALLEMLVRRGDKVATTVLDQLEAAAVRERHGPEVLVEIVDLADPDAALERFRSLVGRLPALKAVAICAAISPNGPVELTPMSVFRRTLEINCLTGVAVYQATLPTLRRNRGRMVFITSMAGRAAMPFIGAYVASKFALEGLGDVMRREAAPQGVPISLVEPGGIRTSMVSNQLATIRQQLDALSPEDRERYGRYYRSFEVQARESYEHTSSTAEQVAAVVLEAMDDADPKPRYVVGEDARQLMDLADKLSDRELDAVFDQLFAEPATAAAS